MKVGQLPYDGRLARLHRTTAEEEAAGFAYLEKHADKEYSALDCPSFAVMERLGSYGGSSAFGSSSAAFDDSSCALDDSSWRRMDGRIDGGRLRVAEGLSTSLAAARVSGCLRPAASAARRS